MTITKRLICVLSLAAMASVPLYAASVGFWRRPGNFTFSAAGTLIPLAAGGATSVSFNGSGINMVSYSAECETTAGWLSIEISVDGVALLPTGGSSDAFCTDGKTPEAIDGWVTASYTLVTANLVSGVHTIRVRGTAVANGGASDTGWLGDSALIVWK